MQRQTAGLLLVVSLVGVVVPAALALSPPPVHACCMRKPLHHPTSHPAQLQAVDCCHHDCGRSLTVSRWAQPQPLASATVVGPAVSFYLIPRPAHTSADLDASRFVRGPPTC
jgi:hypothetical protein